MRTGDKIYIAGHKGMVGSAITRALRKKGYVNLLGKTSTQLDLRDQYAVDKFFRKEKPDHVFLAAARTESDPGNGTSSPDFLYDNLMIEANVLHAAWKYGVRKLLFIGSSC